jgi:hypothetical protein
MFYPGAKYEQGPSEWKTMSLGTVEPGKDFAAKP